MIFVSSLFMAAESNIIYSGDWGAVYSVIIINYLWHGSLYIVLVIIVLPYILA